MPSSLNVTDTITTIMEQFPILIYKRNVTRFQFFVYLLHRFLVNTFHHNEKIMALLSL